MPPLPALAIRVPNPANALLQAEQILGARQQRNALARQTRQQEQITQAFAGGIPSTSAGQQDLVGQVAAVDPQQALQFQQAFNQLGAQDRARVQQEGQQISRALFGVTNQAGYDQAKATLPPALAAGLPAEFQPQAVRSLVQASRSIDSLFAAQTARLPTPPLSEARQAQELAQIKARRTQPVPPASLLPRTPERQAQELELRLQSAAPGETWRPMNAAERTAYGIPEGRAAQISNRGKGAVIGSGGGITLYGPDGNIIAQVGGVPLTRTQTGAQGIEIADEIRETGTRLSELDSALTSLRENPRAAGLSGLAIEKIGGLTQQISNLTGVGGNWLNTAPVQRTRTELAALLGQYIPTITGDESGRYSDQDVRRADAAFPAKNPTASFQQVESALLTLEDIEKRARGRALMRLDGFEPQIDITYPEGQLNYARQLQREGKTFEEAGIIIADLLLKYNLPLEIVGIQ